MADDDFTPRKHIGMVAEFLRQPTPGPRRTNPSPRPAKNLKPATPVPDPTATTQIHSETKPTEQAMRTITKRCPYCFNMVNAIGKVSTTGDYIYICNCFAQFTDTIADQMQSIMKVLELIEEQREGDDSIALITGISKYFINKYRYRYLRRTSKDPCVCGSEYYHLGECEWKAYQEWKYQT